MIRMILAIAASAEPTPVFAFATSNALSASLTGMF
jgi:hypothetical protein